MFWLRFELLDCFTCNMLKLETKEMLWMWRISYLPYGIFNTLIRYAMFASIMPNYCLGHGFVNLKRIFIL